MSADVEPKIGLRERKKMKTKEAIQRHAIRLFLEQGYHETTVEQIAEAAEVSPSTLFRYFPTKEALVLEDDYDPYLIQAFQEQPPDLSPLQAFRNAVMSGFAKIPAESRQEFRERMKLMMSVPELRSASVIQIVNTMQMIAEIVAARVGRRRDDFHVLTFAGAVIGAVLSVQVYSLQHPEADGIGLLDEALAHLEAGLPLIKEK